MTNNSTEPQPSGTTQNSSDAAAKIVDSLMKAIGELPAPARFGAYSLVVVSMVTIITTLTTNSDDYKRSIILVFFAMFSLFVLVMYGFTIRQTKVENNLINSRKYTRNLQEATDDLQIETNKRINRLESIRCQLQEIEGQVRKLPPSSETEFIKMKIRTLLKDVSEDLEAIGSYLRKLTIANEIDNRTKNSDIYSRLTDEYFTGQSRQAEEK